MEKKTKIIIAGVFMLIAGGVGFGVYKIRKNRALNSVATEDEPSVMADTISVISNSVLPTCSKDASFPLKVGSKGKEVKQLQIFLNRFGSGNKIDEDCVFGSGETLPKFNVAVRELSIDADANKGMSKYVYDNVVVRSLSSGKLVTMNQSNVNLWGVEIPV